MTVLDGHQEDEIRNALGGDREKIREDPGGDWLFRQRCQGGVEFKANTSVEKRFRLLENKVCPPRENIGGRKIRQM